MRALRSVLIVAVLAVTLSGCTDPEGDSRSATDSPRRSVTQSDLESIGIAVVPDETALTGVPRALTLTQLQVDRLVAESVLGGGIRGRDLDALAPVAEDLPPISYLLASYISGSDLPGAVIARGLFDAQTEWTQARDVVFPLTAVALFVADLMQVAANETASESPSASAQAEALETRASHSGASGTSIRSQSATGIIAGLWPTESSGPCSTVVNFLATTIQGIFDVLRVIPGVVTSLGLGIFGDVLGVIIEGAIKLAQGVLTGIVTVVTQQVLDGLRIAISAMGVAAVVISYFSDERLVVTPEPSNHLAFAIDPAPGMRGTFTAHARSLTGSWPPAVLDCARASKASLPELLAAGSPANWTLTSLVPLITPDATTTAVDGDRKAKLTFVVGTEDADTAKGTERTRAVFATVRIPRKEITTFLEFAANELGNAETTLLSRIPAALQPGARKVLASTLDPTINRITAEISGSVGGVLTLQGMGLLYVTFHSAEEPTSTPTPSAEPDTNFCDEFNTRVAAAITDLQSNSDVFNWAGTFGAGLAGIQAKPPSALAADFAIIVGFYTVAGALDISNTQPLADFVAANDIDGARNRVWTACSSPVIDPGF